jgi:hypothetical protein
MNNIYPSDETELERLQQHTKNLEEYISKEFMRFLEWRGLDPDNDTICTSCRGSGTKLYPTAATWQEVTIDPAPADPRCDVCNCC